MKKTALNKRGKRYYEWWEAKQKLKEEFMLKGITLCELCRGSWALSFHHKHPRQWYYSRGGLDDFNEVLLVCAFCHDKLQSSWDISDYYFNKMRCENQKYKKL